MYFGFCTISVIVRIAVIIMMPSIAVALCTSSVNVAGRSTERSDGRTYYYCHHHRYPYPYPYRYDYHYDYNYYCVELSYCSTGKQSPTQYMSHSATSVGGFWLFLIRQSFECDLR